MKLLIVGSRSISDFDLSPYVSKDVDTVISGGAGGVDSIASSMLMFICFLNIYCVHATIFTDAPLL